MFMHLKWALITGLLLVCGASPARAALIVVGMDPPSYSGTVASMDVTFHFTGDPGDTMEAFQLSVIGSDPLLTSGGADYGRFSFAPNSALFTGWDGTPADFGTGGFVFYSNLSGAGLPPSDTPYLIGTLSVELAGLVSDAPLLVTLNGGDPFFPTDAAGFVGGNFDRIPVDAAAASQFVTAAAIPEPSTLAVFTLVGLAAGCMARRRLRPIARD